MQDTQNIQEGARLRENWATAVCGIAAVLLLVWLAAAPPLHAAQAIRPARTGDGGRIAWAYYVPYAANSLASLRIYATHIDVLSPHWYVIDGGGVLCSCREAADKNRAQVIQIARANGIKIVPMVLNNAQGTAFSPVLTNDEVRTKAIRAILAELDQQGWDGIQIDFEAIAGSDRAALVGFMAEIAPQVRQRGKIISQAIAAKTYDRTTGWAGGFDYQALAPHADYFTLMTYGYGTEIPRSTQPYNWVDASAAFAASQIPPEKIMLGVGWYGHAWNRTNNTVVSQTWAQAQERSKSSGAAPQWDPVQRAFFFTYKANGSDYTVWYEDRRSQDERFAVMDRHGLGGAAFWRLGHEDPSVWDSFPGRFGALPVAKAPAPPYGAAWGDHQIGARQAAGSLFTAGVTVTNASDRIWTAAGANPFRLGYFWHVKTSGTRVTGPGLEIHTDLPGDLAPGAKATVPLRVQAPPTPGEYLLRVDVVQENVAWFADLAKENAKPLEAAITLGAAALAAPALVTPAEGTALESYDIALRWNLPPGAVQMQVQVAPTHGDGPAINLIRLASDGFTLPRPALGGGNYTLLPGMTYHWRVRASAATASVNEADPSWGAWSAPRAFRTPAASSAGITPVMPAPGAGVSSAGATLRWGDADPAVFYYEVQVSPDPTFVTDPAKATAAVWWNLVHGGQSAPLNSWRTPALKPGVAYYWRVRPRLQGDAAPVAWSPAWGFTAE